MNGILIINKPKDYTSRDVVNEVGKLLKTKQIGHTGTLDPIATGVLVLCVGKATKIAEIITSTEKEYIAEVMLGINTDTLDNTGRILFEENIIFPKEKINECLKTMVGCYEQEVPLYSAVKINGKKLYEYARKNEKINLPKRMVEIKKIEMVDEPIYESGKTIFRMKCLVSKGTYIRSLIRDIAKKLNTVGIMTNLTRIKQGDFLIENSYNLEQIKENKYQLLKISDCLNDMLQIVVDNALQKKIKNGAVLKNIYNSDVVLFKNDMNEVLAVYKKSEKDNQKIKPWKMF